MSMGAYDQDEHERRERKNTEVDANFDDRRAEHDGSVEYEGEESTSDLLDRFKRMQD